MSRLRGDDTPQARELSVLFRRRRVAVTGAIIAEVLRGSLHSHRRERLWSLLLSVPFLRLGPDGYAHAGSLGAALASVGRTVGLGDLLIASAAILHGVPLLTEDSDFSGIPSLALHPPRPCA